MRRFSVFELAATHDPTLARARSRLAHELSQRSQCPQAESLFRQALTLDPDDVQSWFGLGRTLEDLGQAEGALGCYRNVLRRQPGHGMALGQYLALIKDDQEASTWQAQAQAALTHEATPDEAKALVGYGLTKHYDRRRNYREAIRAGSLANAARRRKAGPLDRTALVTRVDNIIGTYTHEFFAARRPYGIGTDQPVFIVGLPRSGTTLTEQILAAHPQLHGAGELPDLARLAIRSLPDETDVPWQAALRLTDMGSRTYAYEYVRALRATATPGRLRISDKQPLNFFQLAFVALLFPNSRVIHCRRDARDTALSIWMENFNPDQRYATDFDDLAFFTAQYRRLMAHWNEALPLKMIDIQYEETVADLENQARRLIDFLGAPWDDRCLDFHNQERTVQTPSRWQVRQPIYSRSVGRWKHYAEYLPELSTAFADFCEESL
ncbi:MAG: sulfotransferase [Nitrospirales bacterium]|nr:sulfotransferase [Nitrospirales bacterium]